jgi:hypothetical protein
VLPLITASAKGVPADDGASAVTFCSAWMIFG